VQALFNAQHSTNFLPTSLSMMVLAGTSACDLFFLIYREFSVRQTLATYWKYFSPGTRIHHLQASAIALMCSLQ
jgi:hypothetical protein